ncbi:hypothetical protein EDD15DRAFT_2372686 [Pisolithus albus]|nr:hypothetical protein EDD15DRAFT_2372686 [Pisolithus albus]
MSVALQRGLKALHSRSFIAPVVPRSVTPPPSPGPSNAGPSDAGPLDAWSITPADIAQMQTPQMQTPDYGDVPWLFQPDFCDFKSFHLGFNVSIGFTQVSLGKRVVRTVCPDRFMGQNGPALPGSVCVTVTGHNSGSAIQHLTIPARYLTPANPTGKNQLCLVLKGPQAGQVVHIKKCQRNSKSVVTEHGVTLNFSDSPQTIDFGHSSNTNHRLLRTPIMGLVQSHFAGMLAVPPKGDAREGSPISGDPAPTAQNFCTATLVEVAQKRKFCEDQDSALGPPTKIPRGTSLVLKTSSVSVQQIPLTTPSLKRKSSEDQDLSLGPPAKVPRTSSLISPRGYSCFIWRLPNELLGHITTFLPPNSLLALTQVCQLLKEIAAPRYFLLLGFDTPQKLSSSLFFTSMSIAFTLSTLRSAPLVNLRLTNTALTAVQWTKFLGDLRLRSLRSLEIEATCPARSLVEFLSRHQVKTLTIISGTARCSSLPHSPLRRARPTALLSSLTRLDGPPSYILSLLRYAYIPGTLEYLGLRLGASSFTDCFLSDVLLCTEHLPGVNELSVRIPAEADLRALALPENRARTCLVRVKDLTLWILNSESDVNAITRLDFKLSHLPKAPIPAFSTSLDDMDGGRLPCYKLSHQFRFHPYARVKPSAREIVMAALYDDTSDEELFVPSSAIADSNAPPYAGRLPRDKLSRQFRFHPYARVKPSACEIVTAALYTE